MSSSLQAFRVSLFCDPGWRRSSCFEGATSWKKEQNKGLVETGTDSQGFCSDVAPITSAHMPLTSERLSPPTAMGQGYVLSHRRCCQSHGNRSREWTTAHNNRTDNMPQDGSLSKPSWLARGFSKILYLSRFALLHQQAYQKRECREDIPSSSSAIAVGLWREEDSNVRESPVLAEPGRFGEGPRSDFILQWAC